MKPDKYSKTAVIAAACRAYHTANHTPKIFDDPFASKLVNHDERTAIENMYIDRLRVLHPECVSNVDRQELLSRAMGMAMRASVLARASYAEEKLADAIMRGISQYLLIGAGLDTFAFRRVDLQGQVTVFEVDHPQTQAFKRERLKAAHLDEPPNLYFVADDLERNSLADSLKQTPFDSDKTTFIVSAGLNMYLTYDAITSLWKSLAATTCSGSELVFDYLDAIAFDERTSTSQMRLVIERSLEIGEPMISGFSPESLKHQLMIAGFQIIEDLGSDAIDSRYFKERQDPLRATAQMRFAHALVV